MKKNTKITCAVIAGIVTVIGLFTIILLLIFALYQYSQSTTNVADDYNDVINQTSNTEETDTNIADISLDDSAMNESVFNIYISTLFATFCGDYEGNIYQYDFTGNGEPDWVVTVDKMNESGTLEMLLYSRDNEEENIVVAEWPTNNTYINSLGLDEIINEKPSEDFNLEDSFDSIEEFEEAYNLLIEYDLFNYDEKIDLDDDGISDYILYTKDAIADTKLENTTYYSSDNNSALTYEVQEFFSWIPRNLIIYSNNSNPYVDIVSTTELSDLKYTYFTTADNTNYEETTLEDGTYSVYIYENMCTNTEDGQKVTGNLLYNIELEDSIVSTLKNGDIIRTNEFNAMYDDVVNSDFVVSEYGESRFMELNYDLFLSWNADANIWYFTGNNDYRISVGGGEITFLCTGETLCKYEDLMYEEAFMVTEVTITGLFDYLEDTYNYRPEGEAFDVTVVNGEVKEVKMPWRP